MQATLYLILTIALLSTAATNAQEAPVSSKFDVWLPGKPWALELEGTGFTTRSNEIQPDGRRYFQAQDTRSRAVVSVYLEALKAPAQPGEYSRCRNLMACRRVRRIFLAA